MAPTMLKNAVSGDYTMNEIALWLEIHYSIVSRAVKKAEDINCNI